MGIDLFISQLKGLGYEIESLGDSKIAIPYAIETGRLAGQKIRLGFVVPPDFNVTPPSGPHISPKIHPERSGGDHPTGGIQPSPLGADWQYWSRPMKHWNETGKHVKDVLAHVRHLFDTQ